MQGDRQWEPALRNIPHLSSRPRDGPRAATSANMDVKAASPRTLREWSMEADSLADERSCWDGRWGMLGAGGVSERERTISTISTLLSLLIAWWGSLHSASSDILVGNTLLYSNLKPPWTFRCERGAGVPPCPVYNTHAPTLPSVFLKPTPTPISHPLPSSFRNHSPCSLRRDLEQFYCIAREPKKQFDASPLTVRSLLIRHVTTSSPFHVIPELRIYSTPAFSWVLFFILVG